ncbi:MAG TPA: uroporphyrinogen decarboxylase family protein [Planctomycetota bacterium]|nr:uroporphyrinogen decarboxylase family protein [Planctomycetota bacterium]
MPSYPHLEKPHQPDWEALVDNLGMKDTPKRVHHMELFHDQEIADAIIERYDLDAGLDPNHPDSSRRRYIALRRFLGFDYVSASFVDTPMQFHNALTEDTADLPREAGRHFRDEHVGPVTNWEEFEKYPWPDPDTPSATREIEWFHENLPDDMCIASHTGHFDEHLCWLMGYESLCYALYDQRDLVQAIHDRILAFHTREVARILEYDRVRMIWGSDDMGFKTGLLISPDDTREFVLSGHRKLAQMAHDAGRLYLLHACGNLTDIIDDLTDDVKLDAKHSFEDTIEDVREVKHTYGRKIALIGGIDVDFLCRSSEKDIRARVRDTLDVCMPGGGYCLGTGNSVANYIPLERYLAMIDEGWRYSEEHA